MPQLIIHIKKTIVTSKSDISMPGLVTETRTSNPIPLGGAHISPLLAQKIADRISRIFLGYSGRRDGGRVQNYLFVVFLLRLLFLLFFLLVFVIYVRLGENGMGRGRSGGLSRGFQGSVGHRGLGQVGRLRGGRGCRLAGLERGGRRCFWFWGVCKGYFRWFGLAGGQRAGNVRV